MIFKTFNNDIDKWTAKIGVFGKSFNELGTAINNAFETSIDNIDNFDENIGFWETLKDNLAPKNENGDSWLRNSLGEIISAENINAYIAELDLTSAKNKLTEIFDWEADIKNGDATWQDYFDTLQDGSEHYIPDLIKNTNDLSKLTGNDLVNANQAARASALAHNEALKQQTLGAKAASFALKGLAVVGNVLATMLISWAIGKVVEAVDNYIHRFEKAKEATAEAIDTCESISSEIKTLTSRLNELNEQIDGLNPITDADDIENLKLESAELEAQLAILKEKERIAKQEADKAAQDSLGMTQSSKYATEKQTQTVHADGHSGTVEVEVASQVTEYEELDYAMDAYEEYKQKVLSLQKELENLDPKSEKYTEVSQDILDLSAKMDDARNHANELAVSVQEQANGLSGDTEESQKLKTAISDVIKEYVDFISTINESTDSLNKNAEAQKNASQPNESELNKKVNDSYDTIKKSYEALQEFEDAMSSGMTESALDGVAELSDNLKVMVAGYHAGIVSADELYAALTNHYNADLKNYSNALIAKNQYSEEFYNAVGLADAEFINSMLTNYGVDLKNCKNYNQARLEIENQTLNKLGDMWSKYYNAQSKSYTSEMQSLARQIEVLERSGKDASSLRAIAQQVGEQARRYESAVYELDKVTYNGITANFDGIGSSLANKNGSGSSSAKETSEDFNWIERAIQKVQRTITNLGKTVSATYKTWSTRNDALKRQISAVNDEITIQQKAYEAYMSQANSLGLDSSYISKIQDGTMSIETITDEALIDKIKKYQELYDQANDAQDAISDLRDELVNLAKQRFDNVAQEFENQISSIEHEINMLESYIDQTEAKGYLVSTKYYSSLAKTQRENIALLESEYASLNSALTEAMNTGKIEKYSDDWYDMMSQIQGVKEELVEANTALIEYNNSLRELEWERFDKGQEMISDLIAESEFLRDLMSDEKMFDEKGNATEFGDATFGLHAVDYNTYMAQADDYAKELLELNKQIAEDPSNQLLLDRRRELIETQREMILSANEEREAMKSLAEEGYNTMLDYMNELIDKRKSALDEMKSLSDYEKTISDQVQTVSELRKIQMALQNDSSESGQLALQQNAVKLKEAEETLRQSELDRQIEEEQKMLDNFADDAEHWVSQRLDNTDQLVSDVVESTNTNSESIKETLEKESNAVGYTISEEMKSIWSGNDGIKSVVSMYGDNFNTNVTTVNNTLIGIKSLLESMIKEADKEASDNITEVTNPSTPTQSTSTTTPTPTPAPSTPSTTTTPSSTSSSSTGTIKVGGRINASGAKIYDYAGDTSGESQYYKSDPYYIVLDEQNNYLKVRHHSLKSGVTGWFKKSDVKAYKTGGLVDYTGLAWVDGQKKKPEAFLNAQDTENIGELKDVLKEVDPLLTVEQIREFTSTMDGFKPIVESMVKRPNFVPNTSMNQNVTIHNEFTLHEVQNGEQVIDYLQRSKRFENIMYDIAFNKNSLAKYRW